MCLFYLANFFSFSFFVLAQCYGKLILIINESYERFSSLLACLSCAYLWVFGERTSIFIHPTWKPNYYLIHKMIKNGWRKVNNICLNAPLFHASFLPSFPASVMFFQIIFSRFNILFFTPWSTLHFQVYILYENDWVEKLWQIFYSNQIKFLEEK